MMSHTHSSPPRRRCRIRRRVRSENARNIRSTRLFGFAIFIFAYAIIFNPLWSVNQNKMCVVVQFQMRELATRNAEVKPWRICPFSRGFIFCAGHLWKGAVCGADSAVCGGSVCQPEGFGPVAADRPAVRRA